LAFPDYGGSDQSGHQLCAATPEMNYNSMKIAFISLPVFGHLTPMSALARELRSRDHDVVFISLLATEDFVRHVAKLPFLPCCEKELPAEAMKEIAQQMSLRQGQEALEFTLRAIASMTDILFDSLPGILEKEGIDALVLDTYHFYMELVPIKLGIPYAHVSNAIHFDYSGATPLCIYDWPHESTPEALARNRKGVADFLEILRRINPKAMEYAEHAGIKLNRDTYTTISSLASITQVPKEFDFESDEWPSTFHHAGPFLNGTARLKADFPWDQLTGQPIIYASMGTLQNGLAGVYREIATAVARRKEMQLVLSIGNQVDKKQIGPLPTSSIVVKHAPQLEILQRASVCITHAGCNTVLESLVNGVPQVAIPVTHDQPGVAARIADKKTGLFVPLKDLTASGLGLLLDEVLSDHTYRENAHYFQKSLSERNGLSDAADLLEEAFGPAKAKAPTEIRNDGYSESLVKLLG
jgi:MGT family glycosyltransferase